MSMTDQDIFGTATGGGGGRLDLPEPPFAFVRWNTKDPVTGGSEEHFGKVVEGPVVCYYRRQQWDNEAKAPSVYGEKLRDNKTPNPKAGQPKFETVHYVLGEDDSITATAVYGTMYGTGDGEPGPYNNAKEKAGLGRENVVGVGFAQKFVKLDGKQRIHQFKFSKPDPATRDRVIAAHHKVVEFLVLVESAYAGARWLRKASQEEKESTSKLMEVIEREANRVAGDVTNPTIAKAVVAKVLPLAMEAATKGSTGSSGADVDEPAGGTTDTGDTGDDEGWA